MAKSGEPRKLVRVMDIGKYIPLGPTQIAYRIKSGELPKPVKLFGGRAAVVFEDDLIAIQQKLAAESAKLNEPRRRATK